MRFLVPVAITLLAAAALLVALSSSRIAAGDEALDLATRGRLAVLPLRNATGEPSQGWVHHGLTEMVTRVLGETPGLEVVPAEVLLRALEGRGLDAASISDRRIALDLARTLGAVLVLDASLQRAGDGYAFALAVHGPDGEVSRAQLDGETVVGLADRLTDTVARSVQPDALRVDLGAVYADNPFFNRLFGMGLEALRRQGNDAAETYFALCLEHQPQFLVAQARLADIARDRGELSVAERTHVELLRQGQGRGDRHLQARSLMALGELAALRGQFEQAGELHEQAYAIYLALQDRDGQLAVLGHRARAALAMRDGDRAEALFVDILELQQALGDQPGQARTLLQLGSAGLGRGDLTLAAELLGQARAQARASGDLALEMTVAASLGEVAARQGRLAEADDSWAEALAFARQQGEHGRSLLLLRKRAENARALGDLGLAEDLFHDLLDLAQQQSAPADEALASLRLATLILQKGYPYQARPHLQRTLELDQHLEDRLALQRLIARFAYEDGRYRVAAETQRSVKALAGDAWQASDEALLQVFERAVRTGTRQPLPGG